MPDLRNSQGMASPPEPAISFADQISDVTLAAAGLDLKCNVQVEVPGTHSGSACRPMLNETVGLLAAVMLSLILSTLQATNGDFYGTTQYGGANGRGTVFKITCNEHLLKHTIP